MEDRKERKLLKQEVAIQGDTYIENVLHSGYDKYVCSNIGKTQEILKLTDSKVSFGRFI